MFLKLKVRKFAVYTNADATDSPPYNFELAPPLTTFQFCAENLISKGNHTNSP